MKTAFDFISFALSHAKPQTLPEEALLPVPPDHVGSGGAWEYLYGTTGFTITEALLNERYKNYYSTHGWPLQIYQIVTDGFVGRVACDCQGLLDYFLGVDVNANYNYQKWCTEKKLVSEVSGQMDIGTAVFIKSDTTDKMVHIGFVCGYLPDGDTLIVEERGLKYGCVITRLSERPEFKYCGKPTAKLDFSEPIEIWEEEPEDMAPITFEVVKPKHRGTAYKKMQAALNAAGYTDQNGDVLEEDGVWGAKSQAAFVKMIAQYAPAVDINLMVNGKSVYTNTEAG